MIGLTSTRVIVVDDDLDEALPIMTAFAKKNVGTAYFDGDPKNFPDEKLCGVRLAILDMDLVGGTANSKSKITTLVNTLDKILSSKNGPYAVIIWTKHPDFVNDFEKYVFLENTVPNPVFSIMFRKADAKDEEGNFDITIILNEIECKLSSFSPLLLLQAWEEQSINSAIEVVNFLSELAVHGDFDDIEVWRESWKKRSLELMHAISQQEAGETISGGKIIRSLFRAFSPLYADRIDSNAGNIARELFDIHKDISISRSKIEANDCAKINSMFHLAKEHLDEISAGNLYIISPYTPSPDWVPSRTNLFSDLVQDSKPLEWKQRRIIRQVLIELSPACDHAQDKIRLARLLPGFIVPDEYLKHFKKEGGFIYRRGPFFANIYKKFNNIYLVLSFRHFFTTDLNDLRKIEPQYRLRYQSFEDLIFRFSYHASRPGMLFLDS